MSGIPEHIPDVGRVQDQPRRNPEFDPTQHGSLTSEDYFVFTRIDGSASLREVILETGFPVARAIEVVRKLHRVGAFLMPGEDAFAPAEKQPPRTPPQAVGTLRPGRPIRPRPPLGSAGAGKGDGANATFSEAVDEEAFALTAEERVAMEATTSLDRDEKLQVLRLLRTIERGTLFDVLGVERDVPKRALKRAYFKVSKQFHPDRYYGKDTGPFGEWLTLIFETANKAFDVLNDDRRRAEYVARLEGRTGSGQMQRFQTHEEHAAELFERGCLAEAGGNLVEALQMFAAVARVDPRARYLRRAGRCALAARQLSLAEEYAKKAAGLQPNDPSSARLLASVFRAAGKLREAEETLEKAMALPLDNDTLLGELQSDLEAVRKDLGNDGQ